MIIYYNIFIKVTEYIENIATKAKEKAGGLFPIPCPQLCSDVLPRLLSRRITFPSSAKRWKSPEYLSRSSPSQLGIYCWSGPLFPGSLPPFRLSVAFRNRNRKRGPRFKEPTNSACSTCLKPGQPVSFPRFVFCFVNTVAMISSWRRERMSFDFLSYGSISRLLSVAR